MKKAVALIFCLAAMLLLPGCTVYTRPAAPPVKVEIRPKRPHARAVWVPGHWKWSRWKRRHVWVPGHWRVKKRGRNKKVIYKTVR
jgi:hypothetical protein